MSKFKFDCLGYTEDTIEEKWAESYADMLMEEHAEADVIDHPNGSITTEKIKDSAVTSEKIKDGSVFGEKLKPATIAELGGIKPYSKDGKINASGLVIYGDGTAVINTNANYGTGRSGDGKIILSAATATEIDAGIQNYKPIVPSTFKPYKDKIDVTSNAMNYSANPVKIGTWIDGTPVWRVAFETTFSEVDVEDITGGVYATVPFIDAKVKNFNNVAVINVKAVCRLSEQKCYVDDYILNPNGVCGDVSVPKNRIQTDSDGNVLSGIYGYIDFVTSENNIK